MSNLTFEEINLLCIYDGGSRQKTVAALKEMRGVLTDEDQELRRTSIQSWSSTRTLMSKLMPLSNSGQKCPEFEITGHSNSVN